MDMGPSNTERPGFHGMALVGQRRAYLSHLPMFMVPHEYQAIFEVTLSGNGGDPFAAYTLDLRQNPPGSAARPDTSSKMYGFEPVIGQHQDDDPLNDLFVLTDLVTPADPHNPASPPVRSAFKGNIYRGHFETGHVHEKAGPEILADVVATVTNAVVFRKLEAHTPEPTSLQYVLFGGGDDLYLAHVIATAPDFDQILGVEAPDHVFTDVDLRHGVTVTFGGRPNSEQHKLAEGENATGRVGSTDVHLAVGTQHYFETDDLRRNML